MANEGFIRQLTNERGVCPSCGGNGHNAYRVRCETCRGTGMVGTTYRVGSLRSTLFAGIVLTVVGVVLVWLLMFLLANG